MKGLLLYTLTALALAGFTATSQAALVNYQFTGECVDCAGFINGGGIDDVVEVANDQIDPGAFPVSATLTLRNYTPGADLARENFYALSYHGSNLLNAFDITLAQWQGSNSNHLSGLLPSGSGPASFFMNLVHPSDPLYGCTPLGDANGLCSNPTALSFETSADASYQWQLGGIEPADFGNAALWSLDRNSVPEPTTTVLMVLGLAGLGMSRRKKS